MKIITKIQGASCEHFAGWVLSWLGRFGVAGLVFAQAGVSRRPAWARVLMVPLLGWAMACSAAAESLVPIVGSPFVAGGVGGQITLLSRDGRFLFVSNQWLNGIKVMSVAADGSLAYLNTFATSPSSAAAGMATSPDGAMLYLATSGSTVNVHRIAVDGSLTQVQAAPLGTASSARNGIAFIRAVGGDFVCVNNDPFGANTVSMFPVTASGTLGTATAVATGGNGAGGGYFASPRLVLSGTAVQRLFVLNAGSSSVSVFDIADSGALTLVGSPVAIGGNSSGAIAVDARTTCLYAGLANGSVAKFNIDATGAIGPAGIFGIGLVGGIDGLTVSPGGAFLVSVDTRQIAVADTATMLPIAGSPMTTSFPTSAEFNPAGEVLYVGGNGVRAFQFAPADPGGEPPVADAGPDVSVNEGEWVTLDGSLSHDPDGGALDCAWAQVSGPPAVLSSATMAAPGFVTPFVGAGGMDLEFELTVDDGSSDAVTDRVVIHVLNINEPPDVTAARPTTSVLWPPNHGLVSVSITGVSDPDKNATIAITSVTQDEPTNGLGDGDSAVDAIIDVGGSVLLRAERAGRGDGRVYRIAFTAMDLEGSASGVVLVKVPHSKKKPAIDSGKVFDSTR